MSDDWRVRPADVSEPLPPTDHVLSGFKEKFTPDGYDEEGEGSEEAKDGEEGEKEGDEEEEEEEKPVIEVKTASYDARFPATNQVSAPCANHLTCAALAPFRLPVFCCATSHPLHKQLWDLTQMHGRA